MESTAADSLSTRRALPALALGALLAILAVVPSGAASGGRYAGMTKSQALMAATNEVIAAGLEFKTLTPRSAVSFRRRLDAAAPRVYRVRCRSGKPAWKVLWPKSDPVYVGRGVSSPVTCD